jgi:hypothetical protein
MPSKPEFNLKRGLLALKVSLCGPCHFYGFNQDCYWCNGTGTILDRDSKFYTPVYVPLRMKDEAWN